MTDEPEGILEAIRSSSAGEEAKDFCIRLMRDAIARKANGDFNMYAAMSSKAEGIPRISLYRNPTGEKYAFMQIIQTIGAITGAHASGLVTEGWHLDVRHKTQEEMDELQAGFDRDGFSISGHPEARECIFVTVETDDETLVATVSLPLSEGRTIMIESSMDEGSGMEGAMTGLRPPPQMRVRALMGNISEARKVISELEIPWMTIN